MQEQPLRAAEPGRRPAQQFAGVDLRRPKGYVAPSPKPVAPAETAAAAAAGEACPRCESRDTKFCYYNNYNTSQPRYICKGCRRYWTKGGTLRNVPVGGGTRKKSSSSSSSSPPSSASSSSSAGAGAKRQKPSKKRRVAHSEPATTPGSAKTTETTPTPTTTTTTPTDAASEITTELVVPAGEDDSFTGLLQPDVAGAVALGLGFSDYPSGAKGLADTDSFEWPAAFDLTSYWSGPAFADHDPAVFLNLP